MLSDIFFFGATTLVGKQTLGEEYCDILQVRNYASVDFKVPLKLMNSNKISLEYC
jgi:hypothetical protein